MPIDRLTEETLPFAEAARRLPRLRGNRPVSPATLWRWSSHGLRGVRLETTRIGGTCCTSAEALRRFFAALDGKSRPDAEAPAETVTRRADPVAKELESIGI